jgi:hypothetical protein
MGIAVRTKRRNSVQKRFVALIIGQRFVRNVETAPKKFVDLIMGTSVRTER